MASWKQPSPLAPLRLLAESATGGVADGFAILSFQPLAARATSSAPAPTVIREAFLDFFADIEWDIRVFGRARALRYQSGRDDAIPADIARGVSSTRTTSGFTNPSLLPEPWRTVSP